MPAAADGTSADGTMSEKDNRHITRDSLFILAELRLAEGGEAHRIKVRNLSSGGLMAEGAVKVARGASVWINLRNAGWVVGTVAWVQDTRFGLAFSENIDPKVVRANTAGQQLPDGMIVNRRWAVPPPAPHRKII